MKAQRKADQQQRGAHPHGVQVGQQVRGVEGMHDRRQGGAVQLDHRHIHGPSRILGILPDALAILVEQHGQHGHMDQVVLVRMQLDLDAVGPVAGGFIKQHVAAGDQVHAAFAFEQETAGAREDAVTLEGGDAGDGQQNGFDHALPCGVRMRRMHWPCQPAFMVRRRPSAAPRNRCRVSGWTSPVSVHRARDGPATVRFRARPVRGWPG